LSALEIYCGDINCVELFKNLLVIFMSFVIKRAAVAAAGFNGAKQIVAVHFFVVPIAIAYHLIARVHQLKYCLYLILNK
jgi:hypothetical protein